MSLAFVYITAVHADASVWPHFMRVFCNKLWKTRVNSEDSPFTPPQPAAEQLFSLVEAQNRIPLAQGALAAQRANTISGIKVLIVLGDN